MKEDTEKIEQRIENMKKIYMKAGDVIDRLPEAIPENVRTALKEKILGDRDLKELMDGIDAHRPPRIFLIGRTGVGKSSLINALCGAYVARVSDTHSCTEGVQEHVCKDGDRVLMRILDTRGIAESESMNKNETAEEMLIDQINHFSPDVAILMLSCTHRDDVDSDVLFLKNLAGAYSKINDARLPIVVVVNRCDEMAPARFCNPAEYPQNKVNKINEVVQRYKKIIVKNGLKIDAIIGVSSLIDWKTPDGMSVDVDNIDNLPEKDIENLEIEFDGRYQIGALLDILEEAIQNYEAQMGLRMAARLKDVVDRFAKHLNKIFSGMAATVALSPIPVADIYVLLILQAILVSLIASLSGRDVSMDSAKEFILSLGGVVGAGFTFRLVAQQSSKFLNLIWPGAGSAVSSGIAAFGTTAIGDAAIAYYLDGEDLEDVKNKFEEARAQMRQQKKWF